jgi:hypothetical protein
MSPSATGPGGTGRKGRYGRTVGTNAGRMARWRTAPSGTVDGPRARPHLSPVKRAPTTPARQPEARPQ